MKEEASFITKLAKLTERRVLSRLFAQSAKVPYSFTTDFRSDRALICIQDVDYQTDYHTIDVEKLQMKEMESLAYIHRINLGQQELMSWLPCADMVHIEEMIEKRWRPSWETACRDEQFREVYGDYIPEVERISASIIQEMNDVVHNERFHTLIHNDLNPGNVLVHQNTDVLFIDWEEARYGSLFLDMPLRCDRSEQLNAYQEALGEVSRAVSPAKFNQYFSIASRYLGLRFMAWNLGAWTNDTRAKEGLENYLNKVIA